MTARSIVVSAVLSLVACRGALAIDQIRTPKALVTGTIDQMGKTEVTIKRTGGNVDKVPANEIQWIKFDSEPPKLGLIRSHIEGGRFEDALSGLSDLSSDGISRLEIKQDIEFYKALASAKLALAGSGEIGKAGTMMKDWVKANPGNFHFFEASEILGDLYVAAGTPVAFTAAAEHYSSLEQAPWLDMKMRGGVAKGRALQAEKKFAEALQVFSTAFDLAADNTGDATVAQKQAAIIGKAACLAETGKQAEGIKLLEEVINGPDPEDTQLYALAYNALGNCQRKAGNAKAALLAFLHVDILYNSYPTAHAEALANLVDLWKEVGNSDRSTLAEQVLQERYKSSRWAKK